MGEKARPSDNLLSKVASVLGQAKKPQQANDTKDHKLNMVVDTKTAKKPDPNSSEGLKHNLAVEAAKIEGKNYIPGSTFDGGRVC